MADRRRQVTISAVAAVLTLALAAGTAQAAPAPPDSTSTQPGVPPQPGRAPETSERADPSRVPTVQGQVLGPAETPDEGPTTERVVSSRAAPPVEATSPVETTVPVAATEPAAATDPIEVAPPVEAPAPVEVPTPVRATASDEEGPPVAESAVQGVSGTVTETGSGAPVPGVFLAVLRSSDYTVAGGAVADGSGNYTASVGAGSYYVYAIDPTGGHASGFFGAPTLVTVTAGATVDADPAMAPTRGSITATVTETGTGAPIGGVWGLALSSSAANPGATELAVVADGSGQLTLPGLTQANHYVGFVDPAGGHQTRFFPNSLDVPHATPVAVTAGATTPANASLPAQTLVGTGSTITGTVTEQGTNTPLANARVFALRAADYQIVRAATSNPSGHYTLDLTPGAYKLAFLDADGRHHLEWYDNQPAAGLASAVSVTAPGTADAALNPSTATMAGTITDETTGDPIADAWVIAIGDQGVAGGTATAADGTYTIAGLPPGTYRAAFIDPTGGRTMEYYDRAPSFSGSTPITLTTATTTIDATLGYPPPGAHCGPITTNETWGPGVHQITCPVYVPAGVALTLAAGSEVQTQSSGYVEAYGSLVVAGTAEAPVRISGVSLGVYYGDSLSVTHAIVSNANVSAAGTSAPVVVTDSVFSGSRYGAVVVSSSAQPVSILRNTISDSTGVGISVSATGSATVDVADNQVTNVSSTGSYGPYKGRGVYVLADPAGGAITPRVEGNSVTGAAAEAVMVVANRLAASSLEDNTGSGNGQNVLALAGHLVEDLTYPRPGLDVGVISANEQSRSLIVDDGVTFTLSQGSTLTGLDRDWCFYCSDLGKPYVEVDGRLQATATSSDPVQIRYVNIAANSGSEISLDQVDIKYASTALSVADGALVTVHGSITDSTIGIAASTWVDATEVNWGSPSGPSPIGSGTAISGGGVFVTPWVGYVAPPIPPPPPPPDPPADSVCASFMFIGARGSGQSPQGDPPSYSGDGDGMGPETYNAYLGFQQRLYELNPSLSVQPYGLRYRALGTQYNPINFGVAGYFESIFNGVFSLSTFLSAQHLRCPSQKFVLAGYSQGALVVHIALRWLADTNPDLLNPSVTAGVALIADPAKIPQGTETLWESGWTPARMSIWDAEGVWTKGLRYILPQDVGPLPGAVTDRTIAICHDNDWVCSPGLGSGPTAHGSYGATEASPLGAWIANCTQSGSGGSGW